MHRNDRTRILHIIGQLGLGGAERQLYYLVKSLADRYKFSVITYHNDRLNYIKPLEKAGADVWLIPKEGGIGGRIKFVFILTSLIRQAEPDIVQTWLPSGNFYGRIARVLSGSDARTIASFRNVEGYCNLCEASADRILCKATDVVISNTFAGARLLEAHGISAKKIKVIHNGIAPEEFDTLEPQGKIQRELSIPPNRIVIGTVGRMTAQKNHIMFLDAARKIKNDHHEFHFVIVGDGELRQLLERKISEYNLNDSVTLTGPRTDIPRVLKAFDLFVLTSLWEGLPNVIMEAMCVGLPVVAANVGGVCELIRSGENGLLVEKDDLQGLMCGIRTLIADPERRGAMAKSAQKTIEDRFSLETMAERTATTYEKLIAPKR